MLICDLSAICIPNIALLQNAGCNELEVHLMNGIKRWPRQDSSERLAALHEAVEHNQAHDWCT